MTSPTRIGLAVLATLVGLASAQADVRVALIGADLSAAGQAAVELAEAELSARAGLTLLDRVAIGNVLREQNLAAEGFARPDDAVQLGQLLAVDVFIHAEAIPG
ncbi:MAG TPA: CsgG/HfaB family protein, partial [Kiritimatiellia bacterium]|nr:CsgG/HfaB family protein [Kiritimatiellia bacterium]